MADTGFIGDKRVTFKVDTGAQVTAVGEDTYKSLDPGPLKKPSKVLYGPTQQRLNAIGQFSAKITVGSRMCKQTIFVVRGLRRNLMGLPAITSLDVARQIGETIVASNVKEHFPKIFDGLGNLGEEYLVKLKGDAVPYSLFTPRNVAIPLHEKVREELMRMEALGIISKVTQPTA